MRLLQFALVAVVLGAANVSGAGKLEEAKAHFKSGQGLFEKGDYELAATEFIESYALSRRPQLLFNISLCYEHIANFEEAAHYLEQFLVQYPEAGDRKSLEQQIARLHERSDAHRRAEQEKTDALQKEQQALAAQNAAVKLREAQLRQAQLDNASMQPMLQPISSRDRGRWYTDGVGATLAVAGIVAITAGAVVVADANSRRSDGSPLQQYLNDNSSKQELAAGAVVLGVGCAGVVGAIFRYTWRWADERHHAVSMNAGKNGVMIGARF